MAETVVELAGMLRTEMDQARDAGDAWETSWADVMAMYGVSRDAALEALAVLVTEGSALKRSDGHVAALCAL